MRNAYPVVSGVVFGLLAVLQAVRAFNAWPVQVSTFQVPVAASWVVAVIAASLCIWAFRSRGQ
jgi:hypothetical protein